MSTVYVFETAIRVQEWNLQLVKVSSCHRERWQHLPYV